MVPTLGPYQVLEQLGEGGAGAVFRARDLRDGTEVALKLLLRPTANRVGRFQLEAATLAKLRHPNVVPVRDYGIAGDGRPYLVLELIQGPTLQRQLETRGRLAPQAALEISLQLASALSAAHAQGLLHRDVKPENVLLRASDGIAILSDFGLAKELGSQLEQLTQTGAIMGTPGFLAPEQLGSSQQHTPALDVYGLGATLYAMLTGEPPVRGSNALEAFQATLTRPPTPPSQFAPIPPALEALCLRCLAKDPQARYPDAGALLDALEELDAAPGPAPRSWRRHPLLLLLPLLILAGAALGWKLSAPDTPPASIATRPSLAPSSSPSPSLAASTPSPSPTPRSLQGPELEQLMARCDRALKAHDPIGAELARELVRLAPNDPRSHTNLGVVLIWERKHAEARAALSRAIELDPRFAAAYGQRGNALIALGELEAAKRDLETAVKLDPNSNSAWSGLGKLRAQTGDYPGAVEAFTKAIEIFPGPLHYADRAALYTGIRKLRLARLDADRAIELGPHLAHPWFVRGELKRLQEDPSALQDFERALKIFPDDVPALAGRMRALMHEFRYDEAVRDADRAMSLLPEKRRSGRQALLLDRGVAHLYRGDYAGARADLEELRRQVPAHPTAWFWLSEVHYRLRDFPKAVEIGERGLVLREKALADKRVARQLIPGLSRSLIKLARAQLLAGKEAAARASLEGSIEAARPRNPYPRLWATALTGDRAFLETWPDPDPWPRPIREYLLGRLPQAELLQQAEAKSPRAVCQVRTFFGIEAARAGDAARAQEHYAVAAATKLRHLDEFAWSELQLREGD